MGNIAFNPKTYQLQSGKVLILRTCGANMESYGGFIWPKSGPVSAPDWKPQPKCGDGLHGWLWGIGNYSLRNKDPKAKWLVVEVDLDKIVEIDKKVKFPSGEVLFASNFRETYDFVKKWFWLTQVKFGKNSIATEKEESAWEPSDNKSASASGDSGHASASGSSGHASASGDYGIACVLGNVGCAKCGENGSIILTYWDGNRNRHVVGYAGENGIEKDTWYRLNNQHQFEKEK